MLGPGAELAGGRGADAVVCDHLPAVGGTGRRRGPGRLTLARTLASRAGRVAMRRPGATDEFRAHAPSRPTNALHPRRGRGDAGSDAWYWHLVAPELEARGHAVVAPDLPCDDDDAGLAEYADVVVGAIGDRTDVVLVAQSVAGLTAPLVCGRVPVALVVLVAAMVPHPGEAPGGWWANTGWDEAHRALAVEQGRPTDGDFDLEAEFLRRVVRERLGFAPDETDGGHLSALSRPHELAARLDAYRSSR